MHDITIEDPRWWHWNQNTERLMPGVLGKERRALLERLLGKFEREGHAEAAANVRKVLQNKRRSPFRRTLLGLTALGAAVFPFLFRDRDVQQPPPQQIESPASDPGTARHWGEALITDQEIDDLYEDFVEKHFDAMWERWRDALGVTLPKPGITFDKRTSPFSEPDAEYDHTLHSVQINLCDGTGTVARHASTGRQTKQELIQAILAHFEDTIYHEFGHHWRHFKAKELGSPVMYGHHDEYERLSKAQQRLFAAIDEGVAESLKLLALGRSESYAGTSDSVLAGLAMDDVWLMNTHRAGYRIVWPIAREFGLPGLEFVLVHPPEDGDLTNPAGYRERTLSALRQK